MPYNEDLANRVREQFRSKKTRFEEKKMMGGLTFMVKKKMCVGILNDDLMARINPMDHESVLKRTGCREMDFTGRPMKGFVFVGPAGTNRELPYWIDLALAYNSIAKASKKKSKSPKAKSAKKSIKKKPARGHKK